MMATTPRWRWCWMCFLLLIAHCSSPREVEQSTPPPTAPQPGPELQFETKTDTVFSHDERENGLDAPERLDPEIRFMVQIGAFKDPRNASRIQSLTRERYHLPVLNDFHIGLSLYQIRIGFFETYESAQEFRLRLQREFPSEYRDAWIVQLKR